MEHPLKPEAGGLAQRFYSRDSSEIVSGHVWMDIERLGYQLRPVMMREILHTLGRNRLDGTQFPNTVMNDPPEAAPVYVLHPLDREALLAVYGWLGLETTTEQLIEELGPWSEESDHLVWRFGIPCPLDAACTGPVVTVDFGVSARNGLVQPWVSGAGLGSGDYGPYGYGGSGVAFWAGKLLGFTSANRPVVGEFSLKLDTEGLHGQLIFRNLES